MNGSTSQRLLALAIVSALAACAGGGGNDSATAALDPPAADTAPAGGSGTDNTTGSGGAQHASPSDANPDPGATSPVVPTGAGSGTPTVVGSSPSPVTTTPGTPDPAPVAVSPPPAAWQVSATTVATGLVQPWAMAFMPDGRALVTQRGGQLRIVAGSWVSPPISAGLPTVESGGQGGLLDIVPSPNFANDQTFYVTFSERTGGAGSATRTAVGKARLVNDAVSGFHVIFRSNLSTTNFNHYGSRLAFGADGSLYVTLGERQDADRAQQLDSLAGKVVRIATDGSTPTDNPYVGQSGKRAEIWSYGHRNPQGLARHPQTGRIWMHEHGPQGGDEVNVAKAGRNYGWPLHTYGVNYNTGTPIGTGQPTAPGIEPPLKYWVPTSIAPSGMAFYTGTQVPGWQNSLFVGALAGKALIRLTLEGETVVGEERLLQSLGERIRDVRMGPDGQLYLLTDGWSGRLMRVVVN